MNLAIFGGSFDPPHVAHLRIISVALQQLDIDKLFVVVAYRNAFKGCPIIDCCDRFEWLKDLTETFDNVVCSDFEIRQLRPVPSIETVKYIRQMLNPNKVYFIIGQDNLSGLSQWDNFYELSTLVEFVVFRRHGYESDYPDLVGVNMRFIDFDERISSTAIVGDVDGFIDMVPVEIRDRVYDTLKRHQALHKIGSRVHSGAIQTLVETMDSRKATGVEVIDLRGCDYICDFVIIATVLTGRHGFHVLDCLKINLRVLGIELCAVDCDSEDWIVVDAGELVIHLFTQGHRDKYNLEEFLRKDFRIKCP